MNPISSVKKPSRKVLLRLAVIKKLGARCSNSDCRWVNVDGSMGCADPDMLHIDHKNGGGGQERKALGDIAIYYRMIEDSLGLYELLCANCNWKKRKLKGEQTHPPHTAEARAKIGKGRRGWKHSAEARRRMSVSAKKRGKLDWSNPAAFKRRLLTLFDI